VTVGGGASFSDTRSLVNAINSQGIQGLTAHADATVATGTVGAAATAAGNSTLTINGIQITIAGSASAASNVSNAVTAINAQSASTGVTAVDTGAGLALTAADGRNIAVAGFAAGGATGATLASYGLGGLTTTTASFDVSYVAPNDVTSITFGGTAVTGLGTAANTIAQTGTAISAIDVTTADNARNALASIDAALSQVSGARASLGATQNRFSSVVSSLQTTAENLTASRSRIQDADFASETAAMTKSQILQQAGTAMVAQANSAPQNVLSLLRG
jgi:flagellin